MTDWGASGRRDTFRATLCDTRTLADIGDIDIIPKSSSITWALGSDTVYSGDIAVVSDLGNASENLIRIYHHCKVDDYDREEPIATMFIRNTVRNMRFKADENKVSCYSTLLRLSEDKLDNDFYRAPGTSILQGIKDLVEEFGGILYVEQGVKDRNYEIEHFFDVGKSKVEAVKEMAGWLNADVIPSSRGYVHLRPKADPKSASPVYDFSEKNSTYLPGVEIDDGRADVCNCSIVYYSIKESTGRWVEYSPASNPYSVEAIGRRIPIITKLTDREYSDEELRDKALEVLHENDGAIKTLTIQHVYIPTLSIGDVVNYANTTDFVLPFNAKCQIVEMAPSSLDEGMMCRTKLKVVD